MLFNTIFSRFFIALASENGPEINDFYKIGVIEKVANKNSEVETAKNREQMVSKNMHFLNIGFEALVFGFLRFWLDFGIYFS